MRHSFIFWACSAIVSGQVFFYCSTPPDSLVSNSYGSSKTGIAMVDIPMGNQPLVVTDDSMSTGRNQNEMTPPTPSRMCQPFLPTSSPHDFTIPITRLYLSHMRKAGGTTLRTYFERVATELNLTLVVAEGTVLEPAGERTDTIYVTHVRDPVQRWISQYEYEGRWSCTTTQLRNPHFRPTRRNSRALQDYLLQDKVVSTPATTTSCLNKTRLWTCSENCFVRWLAMPMDLCGDMTYPILENRAWEVANRYHAIIHVEWLKDPWYVKRMEHFFGVRGLVNRRSEMFCWNETKAANQAVPMKYSSSTIDYLKHRNHYDYSLLTKLKKTCPGPKHVVFPQNSSLLKLIQGYQSLPPSKFFLPME